MRDGPTLVGAVACEAAADMVEETAKQHVVERSGCELQELRGAGPKEGAPERFNRTRRREFDLADRAAEEDVEALRDPDRAHVEKHGVDLAVHVSIEQLVELLHELLTELRDLV